MRYSQCVRIWTLKTAAAAAAAATAAAAAAAAAAAEGAAINLSSNLMKRSNSWF